MPRALPAQGTGLRGPGQAIFPEDAKETGRRLGLVYQIGILTYSKTDDGGGSPVPTWTPSGTVRGRLDPVVIRPGRGAVTAEQVDEMSNALVTVDANVAVNVKDRVTAAGFTWDVTLIMDGTDDLLKQMRVKKVLGG